MGEALEIRDEFRLLLLCARTRIDPRQREQIRTLARKPLDWAFILDKAHPHALIPLLYRNLSEFCTDRVPPAILQQLESDYLVIAERNRANTAELIKVLRILETAGISAVPYKGPALAALAHGDITLRKFWDLDIVVRSRDIIPAKSLLISHGYQWRPFKGQMTGRNEARNIRIWHEYNFVHPDTHVMIDLHWRISPKHFPFNIDLDKLWVRLEPARLLDEDIRTFPVEVLLLFLCVHGNKDSWWKRIGWICDIAELLTSNPDLDWPYTFELAKRNGAQRMLLVGLGLAHELLQAPLPEQTHVSINSDNKVQALIEHVYKRIFDEEISHDSIFERRRFHIKVLERQRDKLQVYQYLVKRILHNLAHPFSLSRKLSAHIFYHSDTTS